MFPSHASPDVVRTALLLVKEFGEFAPAGAFIRADQLRESGDQDGGELWMQIGTVAETLLDENRPEQAPVH